MVPEALSVLLQYIYMNYVLPKGRYLFIFLTVFLFEVYKLTTNFKYIFCILFKQ
jgi:hypothetical protein